MTATADDIDALAADALALAAETSRTGQPDLIFSKLEDAMIRFEEEQDTSIDALIQSEAATAGFLRARTASAFCVAVVCKDGRAREEIREGLKGGTSALVGAIIALLTLSAGFALSVAAVGGIAAGIAAVVLLRGVDGLCQNRT